MVEISEFSTSISPDQFASKSPVEIDEYTFGEPVSRQNFTPFLVDSYSKSRGDPYMQAAYFKYLYQNGIVDVGKTLKSFLSGGGH